MWVTDGLPKHHQTHQDASGSHWKAWVMVRHVWSNLEAFWGILELRTFVGYFEIELRAESILAQVDHRGLTEW